MLGQMMSSPLTVTSILRHATTFHRGAEIVSRLLDGSVHRYTYADMGRRVHRLANALKTMGVKPGDRVATLAWNGYRHLEIYYAVSCLGAICHTINPRLFREQIVYIVNHAQSGHIFFDLSFTRLLEEAAPEFRGVRGYVALCDDKGLPDTSLPHLAAYESVIADQPDTFDWPELDENTASSLCYTSGTTGNPKGVLYSHRSTIIHALAVSGGDWLCLRARDAVLPVVPMFHANAWGIPYAGLMTGCKLVFPGHAMDGKSLYELMDGERVSMIAGVPTVWIELLNHLEATGQTLASVERLMVGGSAAPMSMIRTFEDKHDVRVIHGWGMTEISPVGTLSVAKRHMIGWPRDERLQLQATQGRPLYGIELRIVDAAGKQLPHDGVSAGALQVRGPWVAEGYYKGDDPQSFTADGWFNTGDVASIDEEGFLRLTDRTKDVIKSGGEWISSIELENIAVSHPDVIEAACIAVPHRKWGERPLILVVPRDDRRPAREEILGLYAGKVASWWVPDDVVTVDALPHTATGKLSKLTLREQFKDHMLPTDRPDKSSD